MLLINGNMKIAYIVNARIPTEKAHGYQICKMCEEFASSGVGVQLFFPTRKNFIREDLFEYYSVEKNFSVNKIKLFDFIKWERFFFRKGQILQSLFFLLKLLFLRIDGDDVVYTRDSEIAWLFKKKGYKVFFEAHYWPASKNGLYHYFLKDIDGIICNSRGTLERHKKSGLKRLMVASNGVDLDEFKIDKTREELREELDLPLDKKIIMYVGHLYGWKGVDTVVRVAELMKDDSGTIFVLIGGTDEDILKYEKIFKDKKLSNIKLLGRKKKNIVPKFLKSADILLLPNTPVSVESVKYTSPIKMFEYMASGVPIIASDLPSIREVLNDENAVLVEPDSASEITGQIKMLLENEQGYERIKIKSLKDVVEYSWSKRSRNIIYYFENKLSV
jgi:glycosyltransferase involved in cell wall biosynthesis